jgi:sortase A
MKKICSFIIIFAIVTAGLTFVLFHSRIVNSDKIVGREKKVLSEQALPVTEVSNHYGVPQRLRIPKIGVDAFIESVGLDAKGNMDIPKQDAHVAWYNLGYKLGEKGNTVIAGHLDTKTGEPAVFWDLSKLQSGDIISITASDKKVYSYRVQNTATYPSKQFPLEGVFGKFESNRVNLITCQGQYTKGAGYSNRTVVYAPLISIK